MILQAKSVKCKGQQPDAILFSGGLAGTVYSWTNSTTAIGLLAAGTGNINLSLLPIQDQQCPAAIPVTPSLNGCSGPAKHLLSVSIQRLQ
jgi:hypothetical protein